MESCNCHLAIQVDGAPIDSSGNVASIEITWSHINECPWCATRLIVFDATGVAQHSEMVETSPARLDLTSHGVDVAGGTVHAACERCCGRTSDAEAFPPLRVGDSPESAK